MKRILYPMVLLLAVGCAKENNTAPPTKTEASNDSNYVWLPTGVYTSWDYGNDTTVAFDRFDSLYYTSDLKIDKVVSTIYPYSKIYTVVNQFVYNADGSIDSLKVTTDYDNGFAMNYLFYYDNNGRLDSLAGTYPARDYAQIGWTFKYDGNNHIQHVRSFNADVNYTWGVADYFRNTNGELDSIVTNLAATNYNASHVVLRPGGETVLDATGIDRAYLFLMALQINNSALVNASSNPYWHQYINPDIPLLKSGTFSWTDLWGNSFESKDYTLRKILNVDGTVRWLTLMDDYASGAKYERKDKFVYGKVPGTRAAFQ
ncbi:hypothetical protein [Chitinophaga sp. CF418]|uniref:hypothetical protein n=1 Tax=Chitinophaga sp. CF418 TaxID=1855287 RepID=UPI00091DA1A6|nr:hypothetical protein [Chitinophaga sp. CF418]SHM71444.1 hypothetical protein SAMN05216311_10341 [Chitinophaga sp. CF418]